MKLVIMKVLAGIEGAWDEEPGLAPEKLAVKDTRAKNQEQGQA